MKKYILTVIFIFYINGTTKNIINKIFIADAGYLTLFQRILSLIIMKVLRLSLDLAIFTMQSVAILIILIIGSLFKLKVYKKYANQHLKKFNILKI